jgi:hypothetical protein
MSEGGRISHKIYQMEQNQRQIALARAHQIYGGPCENNSCGTPAIYKPPIPSESQYLKTKICLTQTVGNKCGLSSRLTQQKMQCVIDSSVSSLDPLARFAEYGPTLVPPVCPPVPTEVLNAHLPKASLTKCALPNRPTQSIV